MEAPSTSTSTATNRLRGPGATVGIDLGTTYTCIAICEDGKVTVIKNELGQSTTPSHVAFHEPSEDSNNGNPALTVTVGDAAKTQTNVNPENGIFDGKRLIGRTFNDPVVQSDMKKWPFIVIENDDGNPHISVNNNSYPPEKISALILKYVKDQAEEFLNRPVTNAVITVPAYFNDGQRQATRDAGSIAGLNVLRIINEPTAAAIAYSHQLQQQGDREADPLGGSKSVLIFDLGGGTFDVALLKMEGADIQVQGVGGDTHLGGQDFDNLLVEYCLKEFEKKNHVDLSKFQSNASPNATSVSKGKIDVGKRLRRIKNECEAKKISLSTAKTATISIEVIFEEMDMNVKIKRDKFESLNKHLFEKCIQIVDDVLRDAHMTKEEVNDVVLVGGSSRIPKIQEMLQTYFGGRAALCQNIKQEEAVAYGAAVQASQMMSEGCINDGDFAEVRTSDVIPHDIGVQVNTGKKDVNNFYIILKKNTRVPCSGKNTLCTGFKGQQEAMISIFEGHSRTVSDNYELGNFAITNLPPDRPAGERVDIEMKVNEEGILHVTAICPSNRTRNDIIIDAYKKRLTEGALDQLRAEEINFSPVYSTIANERSE